jgi:hypothetical protein
VNNPTIVVDVTALLAAVGPTASMGTLEPFFVQEVRRRAEDAHAAAVIIILVQHRLAAGHIDDFAFLVLHGDRPR